ncbi:MAG: 50S ribosomal protein L21 [bacterium]|nr:50S ribosomal protein L21 [bacterium]
MYAVVDIAGSQVKVSQGERIRVSRLKAETGEKVTLDRVLLLSQDGETRVGTPQVEGASVEASVLKHGLDKKVIVFKMKRRKGYRRKNGHRQPYTELQIDGISAGA